MDNEKKQKKNATAQFLIFTAEIGNPKIEVRIDGEMLWLTQKLMAELFDTTPNRGELRGYKLFSMSFPETKQGKYHNASDEDTDDI